MTQVFCSGILTILILSTNVAYGWNERVEPTIKGVLSILEQDNFSCIEIAKNVASKFMKDTMINVIKCTNEILGVKVEDGDMPTEFDNMEFNDATLQDDVMKAVMKHAKKIPKGKLICVFKCVLKQEEVLTPDGKINQNVIDYLKQLKVPEKFKQVRDDVAKVFDDCRSKHEQNFDDKEEDCKSYGKMIQCMLPLARHVTTVCGKEGEQAVELVKAHL